MKLFLDLSMSVADAIAEVRTLPVRSSAVTWNSKGVCAELEGDMAELLVAGEQLTGETDEVLKEWIKR